MRALLDRKSQRMTESALGDDEIGQERSYKTAR